MEVVLTFQLRCGCFLPKMEPAAFQQYVFCRAIHSAHTLALVEESISLWLDNKTVTLSPPGRKTVQLQLHKTARSTERKGESDAERKIKRRERGKREKNSKTDTQTHTKVSSMLSVCVQHNLLDSHGSESNILLHRCRPPASDAVRMEHQPEHAF